VRRLEALACGLYWWDPVAWWARREVERAEERCCDAWVLWALPTAAGAYAEALVMTTVYLSGLRQPLSLGASGMARLADPTVRSHQFDATRFRLEKGHYVVTEATTTWTRGPQPVLTVVESIVNGKEVKATGRPRKPTPAAVHDRMAQEW
jgi:hypothetical protein